MAGRCGCGNTTCSCLVVEGNGVLVTGVGSPSSPYLITVNPLDTATVDLGFSGGQLTAAVKISADGGNIITAHADGIYATGGGGGTCPDPMTIAELIALRDASGLDPCLNYVVTDWTSGAGSLPGPNLLLASALGVNELSTAVQMFTPGMEFSGSNIGPNRGTYLWDLGLMLEIWDGLGNHIQDFGLGGIDAFPFGTVTWTQNTLVNVLWLGGYADTSNAVANSVNFAYNNLITALFDWSSVSTSFSFTGNNIFGTFVTSGPGVAMQFTKANAGTITNTSTDTINIIRCDINGGSIVNQADGFLQIQASNLDAAAITSILEAGQSLSVTTSNILDSSVTASVSGGGTAGSGYVVNGCEISGQSSITFTGGTGNESRSVLRCQTYGSSVIAVSVAPGAVTTAAEYVFVQANSTLNVAAAGSIQDSRVSTGFTLSTGAFAHIDVAAEGNFTQTLTAANTNTYRGFGANTLV